MAERGYTNVTVVPLFKSKHLAAGGSGTSDIINLTEIAQRGFFSLLTVMTQGTSGTLGTTVWTYVGASQEAGPYVSPAASIPIGTNGTHGTGGTSNIATFEPEPMPFMKIIATQTGSGNAGNASQIKNAELIVQ